MSSANAAPASNEARMSPVDPRARWMWASANVIPALGVVAAAIVGRVTGFVATPWDAVSIALATVLAVIALVVSPLWRYRVHRWALTPDSVVTQTGWLTQERREAPLNRVQTVDMRRGPLAQLFGLATVTITTASSHGDLHIDGLSVGDARRTIETLTREAVAAGDDAT